MLNQKIRDQYEVTIGIECHVQLKTKTKLFAAVNNDARGAKPNTLISHICLGMPGALPVLNEQVVEYAMRVGFAFNVEPQKHSYFERKHYFYPDLPKGYQITQLSHPIVQGGTVQISVSGKKQDVHINRVQIEEDAGKTTHPAGKEYSLVDLNRAGTPLLEIVSEADMHTAAEAKAYVRELWLLMRYADVSDADLYQGNMRFDVNVSVSKDPKQLGLRTETKNLNSFKSVEKTVEYEANRQIELLEKGYVIVQETRGWDDAKQKTFSQRSKEDAHDYRYFPDPDIPPVELTNTALEEVRLSMPMLPIEARNKLHNIGLDSGVIEDIINTPEIAQMVIQIFESTHAEHARRIAFWLIQMQPDDESSQAGWTPQVSEEKLIQLSQLVSDNKLSSSAAKQVLVALQHEDANALDIAKKLNLVQESDEGAIAEVVRQVIVDNPQAAEDVRAGEMKAVGFLVGQVMKASKGKANPGMAQALIKAQLK